MGHEHVLEAVQRRLDEYPEKMRQRRETVEHPFGTIKARIGATHFLMKTLPKVATEMALHVLAYNLTRVMNIIGVPPLMAVMKHSRPRHASVCCCRTAQDGSKSASTAPTVGKVVTPRKTTAHRHIAEVVTCQCLCTKFLHDQSQKPTSRHRHQLRSAENSKNIQIVTGYDGAPVKLADFVDHLLFRIRIRVTSSCVGAMI